MTLPQASLSEIDLSVRVPSFAGVVGGIVIPVKKGLTDRPVFVESDSKLLSRFTPNEKIEVGYDFSYFSATKFLEKSNTLYVMPVMNGAMYGGLSVKSSASSLNNTALPDNTDLADPTAYDFDDTDELFLIHGSSAGAWPKDIAISIINYTDDPELVQEENAFLINVFKRGNLNVPVESFLCSRVEGAKDGYGNNIYIEDQLLSSAHIRAFDDNAMDSALLPKSQLTPVFLGGGEDGNAVTDADMINGALKFSNPDEVDCTVLMDGGYATPNYQKNFR